jgi:hypothetical protein
MQTQNAKTAPDANRSSFQNHLNADGITNDFHLDIATHFEKFQSNLTEHLARHKVIRLACRCFSCNKAKSPLKMFSGSPLCRDCIHGLKGKGKTARNNFAERVKSNIGKFVHRLAV